MRGSVSILKLPTGSSKRSTQLRMTVWESDYPSVAPLSRVIRVVYGPKRMMVRELRSHFLFLGDPAARPAPTVIVTCGRLPWPIRVLHKKSMKVTFSSDRDHLHPPRWC